MIPIYNISLNSTDKKFVNECLKTNWISSQGNFIDKLEKKLANYHKMKYCLVTSSCTSALDLSIKFGFEKRRSNLSCSNFISPANMILNSNLRLVLIDIDPITLTIDIDELKKKISKKTKALIVVNQFGHVADFDKIIKLSKKYNFKIIEDNAKALERGTKEKLLVH